MATVLGKLIVTLGLDDGDFHTGIGKATKAIDGLGGSAQKGGALVAGLASGGLVAVAGGLALSVNAASDFQHTLSAVGAVSGATNTQMGELHDTALRIGKDTAFSANEAASAMETLAANGVPVVDILGGAADAAVALAAAGGTDLVTAADLASTSMTVWGIKAGDMTDVVNRLAGAANVSRFGVEDMALAVAQGGGVAAGAGVEFGDFSTAIAAISPLFSSGSDAGTSFKQMILSLANPTDKAKKTMADLGLSFYDSNGQMKSMGEIAGMLHTQLGGLTEQQRTQALAVIFGSDASRAALGLSKLTREEFDKMSETMGNTSAADVAAARQKNFAGALENLKGSIETVEIEIGEKLLPVLTELALFAAQALPAAFDWAVANLGPLFTSLGDQLTTWGPIIAGVLVPAFVSMGTALSPLFDAISGNQAAMEAFGILIGVTLVLAFAALVVPIAATVAGAVASVAVFLLVAAAVAAVVAAVVLTVQHWDELTAKFPILETALTKVKGTFNDFVSWVTSTFLPLLTSIGKSAEELGIAVYGFIKKHWDEIEAFLGTATKAWLTQIDNVFKLIQGAIEGALKIIQGIIDVATGIITLDWDKTWKGIKEILDGAWTLIQTAADYGVSTLKNVLVTGWNLLKIAVLAIADELKEKAINAFTGLAEGIEALPGRFYDAAMSVGSSLMDGLKDALGNTAGFAGDVGERVLEAVKSVINTYVLDPLRSALNFTITMPGDIPNFSVHGGDYIPHLYMGTASWRGGAALVGDRGPEIVNLPRGAQVFGNARSEAMMREAGAGGSGGFNFNGDVTIRSFDDIDMLAHELDERRKRDEQRDEMKLGRA